MQKLLCFYNKQIHNKYKCIKKTAPYNPELNIII